MVEDSEKTVPRTESKRLGNFDDKMTDMFK
jgi:hypothetical protein